MKLYKHEELIKEFFEWVNNDVKRYKPFIWFAIKLDNERDLYNRRLIEMQNEHFKELYEKQLEINKLNEEKDEEFKKLESMYDNLYDKYDSLITQKKLQDCIMSRSTTGCTYPKCDCDKL